MNDLSADLIESTVRYRAFFSYARADGKLAAKLHRFLDSYRVPKALRGMPGKRGPVPASLHPIFRDREDLAGGGDLAERLRSALESSEALVVLCTPAAAQSHWVDEEVRLFRARNGNDSIFPVIGAGDPESDDPEVQCMPPSLRDATVLAADLRNIRKDTGHIVGDGPAGGRQKLLAGLLGLDLDHLRRREDARRRRQMLAMAGALVLFVGLAIAAALLAFEADKQRGAAQQNLLQAQVNEARAQSSATRERSARLRESDARKQADAARALAEEQRRLALANAAEALRQAGIAQSNAVRAQAQFVRAQGALADGFAQRGRAAADQGRQELALRYALAGARISPGSEPIHRVLLARLTTVPDQVSSLRIQTGSISFLEISPDGQRLMTSGTDKVARLFALPSGEQFSLGASAGRASKGRVSSTPSRAANSRGLNADPTIGGTKLSNNWFSADSRRILVTLEDGSFELRSAADGAVIRTLRGHGAAVLSGSFHPDGMRVLTGSLDGTAQTWSLTGGDEGSLSTLRVPQLRSAAWGADGNSIVTMSLDSGLQLWRGGRAVTRMPNRDFNSGALAITADARHAIEIDRAGVVRLSRMSDRQTEVRLESGNVSRGAFAISADSRFVSLGLTNGRVVVWDIATRQKVADFVAHDAAVSSIGLSSDNRLLASATNRGDVRVWNLASVFASFRLLANTACRSLSRDARRFSPDERAADPLIDVVWGNRELC